MPVPRTNNYQATSVFTSESKATAEPIVKRIPPGEIILNDDRIDFYWSYTDQKVVAEMWRAGVGVPEIADKFNRLDDEVLLVLIHLARKRKIKRRAGDLLGKAK